MTEEFSLDKWLGHMTEHMKECEVCRQLRGFLNWNAAQNLLGQEKGEEDE